MSYYCGSRNFSSQSLGGFLRYPLSTYNSFYPSKVAYSSGTYQLGSSLYGGNQESFCEPISNQEQPGAEARSFQTSSYCPRNFIISSPCQTNYSGYFGYGNSGFGSFGSGSFQSGFQSPGCGSSIYRPTYFSSRSCQSICNQSAFGSSYFGGTY